MFSKPWFSVIMNGQILRPASQLKLMGLVAAVTVPEGEEAER
jgi:hypothetical protein